MLSGATLIFFAIWGLGFSEFVLIAVAILFLIAPDTLSSIKPFVKVAYKKWLSYIKEVREVQGEMEGVKESLMKPLKEAEAEAEAEFKSVEKDLGKSMEETRLLKKEIKTLMDQNRLARTTPGAGMPSKQLKSEKEEKPMTGSAAAPKQPASEKMQKPEPEPKRTAKKAKDEKGAV